MRLKHLQLHGYKTFATKTEFLFPSGITAIIGPNGSGKSNIADAIRWVLGEQSYSTLRGKRTEDMIFSGSQSRPRAGMAEVSLTLDNTDGWLPVEFTEVTIGRRAYRDGQNEYRLNNNRVRLKDILELLAQSGLRRQTYTIVGQGLVDAVLSLRASERRELFEEAAGIAHYRDRRAKALKELEEVHHNLERVHDIITEIEPRLKRLERQAERAREHTKLADDLQRLLRTWYGYRWGQATQTLDQARRVAKIRAEQHSQRLEQLQTITDKIDRVRQEQTELRRELSHWHRQSSALHTQAESVQRELAVLAERSHQLTAQRDEHLSEIAILDARLSAHAERIAAVQAELDQADQTLASRQQEAQAAQAALDARQAERDALARARSAARERHAALRTDIAERQSRWETLAERLQTLDAETRANQEEIARLQKTLSAQTAQIEQVEARLADLNRELQQARQTREKLEQARQALSEKLNREEAALRKLRDTETQVVARFELLSQLRRDFAVYGHATRAVLTADLPGVRGVLAQLITVQRDRQAVEAALGAYAGAIVVDDWRAAQDALRHLRHTDVAGRVVFVSLTQPDAPPAADALATRVQCSADLRPLVNRLLGRAFLVDDLAAVRAPQPGDLYVTTDGDVLRADGILEGGRPAEQTSPLAQEQEWADLNARRVKLGARRETLEEVIAKTRNLLEKAQKQLAQSSVTLDDIQARQAAARSARDQASRQADRLQQEVEWRQAQLTSAESDRLALRERQSALTAEINELARQQSAAEAEIRDIDARLDTLPTDDLSEALTAAQMALAAAQQTRQGQQNVLRELETGLDRLVRERESRQKRVDALTTEKAQVGERVAALTQDQSGVATQLEALATKIEPAEARLDALEKEQRELEKAERIERTRTHEFEGHLATARLRVQRCEDELARLSSRIEEDLGLVELDLGPGVSGQTPLPLHPIVSKLPVVDHLPDGLEEEIKRLRAQMRRLGAVNPNAPEEYQETLERYEFLQNQSNDLIEASESLRQIIAEMDGLIEHAFRQTFEAVAAQFSETFTALFGGGKARLELTDPNDLSQTGVEIVAQPPGKRLQALASLSGGERSLTAVALIFSILKVSPTPFCILDEVDAALDEANVGRFRKMLESLTEHTQVVIITHNRGTISAADTIYGISMGTDSVSQAYSIRMDGEKIKDLEEIEA